MKVLPPVSAHEGYPQGCVGVRNVRGVIVKVITRHLTKEESRKIFPYRLPFSEYAESRFGGDKILDDEELVKRGLARPCKMCDAATKKEHLLFGVCPDCDGRSEVRGEDPHRRVVAKECCGNCNSD